jgi:hypothetical protein
VTAKRRRRAADDAARRRDPLYAQLEEAIASATQEHVLVGRIAAAAAGNWRASAFLLERQHPERWGPTARRVVREAATVPADDDPFAEVDELAARRRERLRPDGY